ncbi:MAG: TIGR03087 family PEP-CTERM/XrtA system glycosyltransferase [Planctomycetota bacterium]|jgi:sugar transferase (PEP-CTERM/EpsH1 system associated)
MKIVMLTHRLPYAPNRGDRIRAYHLLREMARNHEVHIVSLAHDEAEENEAHRLDGIAASVSTARVSGFRNRVRGVFALPGSQPLTHLLLHAPEFASTVAEVADRVRPDLSFVFCSGVAPAVLDGPLARVPFVLDMVDVDSLKWKTLSKTSRLPMSWIYARETRLLERFERLICDRAATTIIVNEREWSELKRIAPDADIRVVPNGIDLAAFRPTGAPSDRPRVVFTGMMDYTANEEAALRLANRIWPWVKREHADAELYLVGANPTARLRALPDADSSVVVTGRVDKVEPYLWDAAVACAPLSLARGVQNKVLEAVVAGLPSVITSQVAAGLPDGVLPACEVAEDDSSLAHAIVTLLKETPAARRARAESADLDSLNWQDRLSRLESILEEAAAARATPA